MLTRIESPRPDSDRAPAPADAFAIRIRGLSRHYRNPWTLQVTRGVEDVRLDVRRGEVLGLLGPNGAGTTTTITLLRGPIRRTAGDAELLGRSIDDPECRRRVGFLPEQPYFYDYLNGLEYLELAAGLSGRTGREAASRAQHWLARV